MYQKGDTTFEQLPSRHSSTPWAYLIIVFVLIAFGGFWYYERSQESFTVPIQNSAPISETIPSRQTSTPQDTNNLQAATINTAIPDYSSQF